MCVCFVCGLEISTIRRPRLVLLCYKTENGKETLILVVYLKYFSLLLLLIGFLKLHIIALLC